MYNKWSCHVSSFELERKTSRTSRRRDSGKFKKAVNLKSVARILSLSYSGLDIPKKWGEFKSEMMEGVRERDNHAQFQKVLRENWSGPFQPSHATYAGGA